MTGPKDITDIVRNSICKYGMIQPEDSVVVAVSGGADSVCLLDVLGRLSKVLNISLIVAHFNHGLREGEDEYETILVKKIADSLKLPFVTEEASCLSGDMPSLEERAREVRYDFLERVRLENNAQKIALGHTMDDQAETVLMRLLRGSGPAGLSGIPPVREKGIIRPLIEVKREEISKYLDSRGMDYASDSSNSSKKHLRNRIRLELLPVMKDFQPRLIETLGRLSNVLREDEKVFESMADEWLNSNTIKIYEKSVSVDLNSFNSLLPSIKYRVIRIILKRILKNLRRIDYRHLSYVEALADSEKSQASVNLPNGVTVNKSYERLIFSLNRKDLFTEYCCTVRETGEIFLSETGQIIRIEETDAAEEKKLTAKGDRMIACLNADRIKYPIYIRNIRPGDRFIPLGMRGMKKVKDYFIDIKLPSKERASVPILLNGTDIMWICGYRIDERYKVTADTKRILKVTCIQPVLQQDMFKIN